ncbi:hypothetical protein [Polaromonas sp.]|uniref:hypothetical protein n=1 Tax=Polaromonas sp. TaxID=1869339 RepID=UPI00286BE6E0|nr:hypothetical protein [Polaromonas sp.]
MFKALMNRSAGVAQAGLIALLLAGAAGSASAESEWLAICSQCVSPTIFAKSGIGTANARAEARITRADVQSWCASWQPDDKSCVRQQLAAEDLTRVYRATANCQAGRITPIDGKSYTLAGVWDGSDIGRGRSKWRDAAGRMVGRDNASGGLGISQQWELLCPGAGRGGNAAQANPRSVVGRPLASAAPLAGQRVPAAEFAVGQAVQVRYGREWVRARVNQVTQRVGPRGPEVAYDVSLENGKRGIVPSRMLRPS